MNIIKSAKIMIDRSFPLVESWYFDGCDIFDHYYEWVLKKETMYNSKEIYDSLISRTEDYDQEYNSIDMVKSILIADFTDDPVEKQKHLDIAEDIFISYYETYLRDEFGKPEASRELEFGAKELNDPIPDHNIPFIHRWIIDACSMDIDPIPILQQRFSYLNWVVTGLHYTDHPYQYPTYKLNEKPLIIVEKRGMDIEMVVCVLEGDDRSNEYHTSRDRKKRIY